MKTKFDYYYMSPLYELNYDRGKITSVCIMTN